MPERKPANQSWQSFTEQQIQSAQQAGAFDKLPGLGRPIPDIDVPVDDNWWVRRKLQDEKVEVLPPLLEAKRDIEHTRREIDELSSEPLVREKLIALAQRVQQAFYSPLPSPPVAVMPIDVEAELTRWRDHRAAVGGAHRRGKD